MTNRILIDIESKQK